MRFRINPLTDFNLDVNQVFLASGLEDCPDHGNGTVFRVRRPLNPTRQYYCCDCWEDLHIITERKPIIRVYA